jgi:hypothetical protein
MPSGFPKHDVYVPLVGVSERKILVLFDMVDVVSAAGTNAPG